MCSGLWAAQPDSRFDPFKTSPTLTMHDFRWCVDLGKPKQQIALLYNTAHENQLHMPQSLLSPRSG